MRENSILRFTALLLAAAIVLVLLVSGAIFAEAADHHCVGDGCPICAAVTFVQTLLGLVSAAAVVTAGSAILRGCSVGAYCRYSARRYETAVTLKVRMLD